MANFFNRLVDRFSAYDDDADYDADYDDLASEEEQPLYRNITDHIVPQAGREQPRIMNMQEHIGHQVAVIHPDSMEAAQAMTSQLRSGRTVICNFEQVDQQVAQRVVDFITGAAFALDGQVQKISSYIFVIVPSNVRVVNMDRRQEERRSDHAPRYAYGM